MKTIIVPTDFSAPAESAMLYAGELATNTSASLLLLHVYQIPVGMNDMPVVVIPMQDLKNVAEAGLLRAKELLQQSYPALSINTESRMGDVVDELNDLCQKENPFMIVVGKHGATGVERVLFGSTSLSISRHMAYPVIVVPDHSNQFRIKNIALAIDASVENTPVQRIKNIVTELKAQLHLVHVQPEKSGALDAGKLGEELNAKSKTIYDHEFIHGIEAYIQENDIDLLMVLPHKHNLIERLFYKTHTPELLQKISIPIMCINEEANAG